eukprot:571510-Rhodomonas_salina.2
MRYPEVGTGYLEEKDEEGHPHNHPPDCCDDQHNSAPIVIPHDPQWAVDQTPDGSQSDDHNPEVFLEAPAPRRQKAVTCRDTLQETGVWSGGSHSRDRDLDRVVGPAVQPDPLIPIALREVDEAQNVGGEEDDAQHHICAPTPSTSAPRLDSRLTCTHTSARLSPAIPAVRFATFPHRYTHSQVAFPNPSPDTSHSNPVNKLLTLTILGSTAALRSG